MGARFCERPGWYFAESDLRALEGERGSWDGGVVGEFEGAGQEFEAFDCTREEP